MNAKSQQKNPRVGLLGDFTYQVTTTDSGADNPTIATINETKLTIDLGGQSFSVGRKGVLGPEYQLKSAIKSSPRRPKNRSSTTTDSWSMTVRKWTFKAVGLLALKFGLFQGTSQVGTIATRWVNRLKNISVDLPEELPREMQVFLLLLLVRKWSDTNN